MSEKIYILLPVHNRREITRRFISCLVAQTFQQFHLVLIDDGCHDGTVQMVRENVGQLTVLSGSGDWWWAGSLQQGYRWLKGQDIGLSDLVLIINDDTEFEEDFLRNAAALLRDRDKTMLLARCYCREDGRLLDAGVHADWSRLSFEQAAEPGAINCFSTRGLFLRVSDFLAVGGFRPALLPHYASDYEFTIRAHRKGMQLISDVSCRLRLDQSATGCEWLEVGPLRDALRILFSNRSPRNPRVWTAFIALSCPWRYKLINVWRVWANFLIDLCRRLRLPAAGGTKGTR